MVHRHRFAIVVGTLTLALLGKNSGAQDQALTTAQPKVDVLVTSDLKEVGLAGQAVAQRVTLAPNSKMADHTHTGRTSLLVMVEGALTEVRGSVRHDYKAGDVLQVSEGVTHHAENYAATPAVYIEINMTAKK